MEKRIRLSKSFVLAGLILVICLVALFFWIFWEEEPEKEALILNQVQYSDLAGWDQDNLAAFLPSFHQSCKKIRKLPDTRSLGADKLAGTAADWKDLCAQVLDLPADHQQIKSFLEANFTPFQVSNNGETAGLFTGYYEASLRGSRAQSEKFSTPLYLRPQELVMVNLGQFRESLKGQRIAGEVKNGTLVPYHDRADIEKGALENRDMEIVWVDSAVDAFFLHIQGSGRIALDDGDNMRVGYAAQNGHPYFAIGRTLIEEGHVPREKMSMQAIRSWLEENPDRAQEVMEKNASYIFFRELKTSGPLGAQGVELTAGRSLAVDRKWMPLGIPVWLDTELYDGDDTENSIAFQRLLMAQDTGGAIRGPVRGDVFWGHGSQAYERAGSMKSTGQYWILLPNSVAIKHYSKNTS